MGVDEEGKALASPEFWNSRYDKADGQTPTHEWFRSYDSLQPFFQKHLFQPKPPDTHPQILHLGSGDSIIPHELFEQGYVNQTCVDFSEVVVEMMRKRHAELEWKVGDVRNLEGMEDGSVDVAFDKGTLDAMIYGSPWNPPEDVLSNVGRYVREVNRVLKDDGVWLYVTFRQPHFIRPLLNRNDLWDLEVENLNEDQSGFDYYGWILRKAKK